MGNTTRLHFTLTLGLSTSSFAMPMSLFRQFSIILPE
uniref:Uncharacterized protein n=1 Tax=Lepeophtheirus salmonis TaxID=72036 RepID=A0A0K2V3U8_LEPSM